MADKIVTLHIPDALYERVQQVAAASERPFESVVVESLDELFTQIDRAQNVDSALDALQEYEDFQLWAVVKRRLSPADEEKLYAIKDKEKSRLASPEETAELDQIMKQVNRDMLFRSQALVILKERGHDIDTYLKMGT